MRYGFRRSSEFAFALPLLWECEAEREPSKGGDWGWRFERESANARRRGVVIGGDQRGGDKAKKRNSGRPIREGRASSLLRVDPLLAPTEGCRSRSCSMVRSDCPEKRIRGRKGRCFLSRHSGFGLYLFFDFPFSTSQPRPSLSSPSFSLSSRHHLRRRLRQRHRDRLAGLDRLLRPPRLDAPLFVGGHVSSLALSSSLPLLARSLSLALTFFPLFSRSLSSLPFFSPPLSNARPDRMKGYNMEGTKKRGLSPAAKQKVRSFFRFFFFLSFCHFLFLQKSSRFLPLLLTFPPTISTTNYRNLPRPRRRSSPTTAEAASK